MERDIKLPKEYIFTLNQLFEIEKKVNSLSEKNSIQRNIDRLKDYFLSQALPNGMGLSYHDPLGENYSETRNDCTASISGDSHENLRIVEVMKPIIYLNSGSSKIVFQKAIVIAQSET